MERILNGGLDSLDRNTLGGYMNNEKRKLPQEQFGALISQPVELDRLGTELNICFRGLKGPCEIKTCYGDICKIVNALRDYSRLLRMACDEWALPAFQQAFFELHAEKLETISKKFQSGIGYDYDKALEKCQKKRRKHRDDIGDEALALAYRKSQMEAETKKSGPEQDGRWAVDGS